MLLKKQTILIEKWILFTQTMAKCFVISWREQEIKGKQRAWDTFQFAVIICVFLARGIKAQMLLCVHLN